MHIVLSEMLMWWHIKLRGKFRKIGFLHRGGKEEAMNVSFDAFNREYTFVWKKLRSWELRLSSSLSSPFFLSLSQVIKNKNERRCHHTMLWEHRVILFPGNLAMFAACCVLNKSNYPNSTCARLSFSWLHFTAAWWKVEWKTLSSRPFGVIWLIQLWFGAFFLFCTFTKKISSSLELTHLSTKLVEYTWIHKWMGENKQKHCTERKNCLNISYAIIIISWAHFHSE